MENLEKIMAMGGYGEYVWPSFGIALVVILAMIIASWRGLKRAQKSLSQLKEP